MEAKRNRDYCYIYIDGGCWPNPGGDMYYAYGVFPDQLNGFESNDKDIKSLFVDNGASEFSVGYAYNDTVESSNNVAEYVALYNALSNLDKFRGSVTICCDSLMLVKQMSGEYKVREGRYKDMFRSCCDRLKDVEIDYDLIIKFVHVPRENNIAGVALEIFRNKFYHS